MQKGLAIRAHTATNGILELTMQTPSLAVADGADSAPLQPTVDVGILSMEMATTEDVKVKVEEKVSAGKVALPEPQVDAASIKDEVGLTGDGGRKLQSDDLARGPEGLSGKDSSSGSKRKREVESRQQQWRTSRMVEDYVNLVSDLMVPNVKFARYGFAAEFGEYPVERPTLLGVLMSPCRRPTVFENWSPREIAVFEGCIALYGKDFRTIQRFVRTKNTKEIIEFYYLWKLSSHYTEWKRNFVPEFPSPYDPEEPSPRR